MKKTVICLLAIALISSVSVAVSLAVPAGSKTLSVSATVADSAPEIDITILKFTDGNPDDNPWTNSTDVTSSMKLDFETLVHTYVDPADGLTKDAGVWFSNAAYCVVIYTQGYSNRYEVLSTCAGLGTLPGTAFGLTPVYSALDKWVWPGGEAEQGAMPSVAILGVAGTAVATNKSIYLSEPAPSTPRILQAYYGIPPKKADSSDPFPGWVGIPLNQAPGPYSGTVVISIVAR